MANNARNGKGQFAKGFTRREAKPYWDKEWLLSEYIGNKKSTSEIAKEHGCNENNICYFLIKFNIPRRTVSQTRQIKKWGQRGENNPMWGKTKESNPNYKGGVTPERQSFYISSEWKRVRRLIWKRDKAVCQRCGQQKIDNASFHIHHIKSFAHQELRCDINNLILLCKPCHQWVHSKRNTNNDYL